MENFEWYDTQQDRLATERFKSRWSGATFEQLVNIADCGKSVSEDYILLCSTLRYDWSIPHTADHMPLWRNLQEYRDLHNTANKTIDSILGERRILFNTILNKLYLNAPPMMFDYPIYTLFCAGGPNPTIKTAAIALLEVGQYLHRSVGDSPVDLLRIHNILSGEYRHSDLVVLPYYDKEDCKDHEKKREEYDKLIHESVRQWNGVQGCILRNQWTDAYDMYVKVYLEELKKIRNGEV